MTITFFDVDVNDTFTSPFTEERKEFTLLPTIVINLVNLTASDVSFHQSSHNPSCSQLALSPSVSWNEDGAGEVSIVCSRVTQCPILGLRASGEDCSGSTSRSRDITRPCTPTSYVQLVVT